jgi:hypothetical protein
MFFSRREPSNYRRSASRRSIIRGPVPVDKLLFLRYRAKENMRLGMEFSENDLYFVYLI